MALVRVILYVHTVHRLHHGNLVVQSVVLYNNNSIHQEKGEIFTRLFLVLCFSMINRNIILFSIVFMLFLQQGTAYPQSPPKDTTYNHELVKICTLWGNIKYVYSKPNELAECDSVLVQFLRTHSSTTFHRTHLTESQFRQFAEHRLPQMRNSRWRQRLDTILQIPSYTEQKRFMSLTMEFRLLSLFDAWNIVRFHFAYLHLVDNKWEQVLEKFIPKFEQSSDSLEYLECVMEFSTYLRDSHVRVYSPILDRTYSSVPPVEVDNIEHHTVVTNITDSARLQNAVKIGDVISFVDGKPIAFLRNQWKKRIAASTNQYFEWRFHRYLLAGDSTPITLSITRNDSVFTVYVPRSHSLAPTLIPFAPKQKLPERLPSSIAYVDLTRLQPKDVDSIFSRLSAQGLILDLRGYPQGTFDRIFSWLTAQPTIISQWQGHSKFFHPRTEAITATVEKQILHPGQKHNSYNGAIVVLVNASAISQAEHTCLALFQSRRGKSIRFVGEATAGANGGVKYATLANNVRIRFSSEDIRYADGRQLQRIGILPNVEAKPTIAGIRAGRDEVLEKGMEVLREMITTKK
jgi:C-terminal processing protease CtpA/Prc